MTHPGSHIDTLSRMALGAHLWVEVPEGADHQVLQRLTTAASRYPAPMKGWRFTTSTYRAVPTTGLDDPIKLLVRIERTA